MKKLLSASIAAATIAGFAAPAAAVEGLSANAGFVTDYYYRGGQLGDASAYAGVDYEMSGFYAGAWAIDDGTDMEVDTYLGYGMESGDFSWALGLTRYDYTYGDNAEQEFNLGLGFAGFSLDVALGEAISDVDNLKTDSLGYTVVELSWAGEIFGAKVGMLTREDDATEDAETAVFYAAYDAASSEYSWVEVSAGGEVAGVDVSVTLGSDFGITSAFDDDSGQRNNEYLFLDVSKSFDL
jgi:hypothetical protein